MLKYLHKLGHLCHFPTHPTQNNQQVDYEARINYHLVDISLSSLIVLVEKEIKHEIFHKRNLILSSC